MPDDATGDLCPTCGGEFELEYHGQLEVDRCTSCRSIWFDRTELAAYARRKAAGVVTWGKRVEHLGEAPGPYSCPRCKEDTLTPYKSRTLEFLRCSGCEGIHVTKKQLVKLVGDTGEWAVKLEKKQRAELETSSPLAAISPAVDFVAGVFAHLFH